MLSSATRDRAFLYIIERSLPSMTGSRLSVKEVMGHLYFKVYFRVLTLLLISYSFLNPSFPLALIFSYGYSEKPVSIVFGELLHPFGK